MRWYGHLLRKDNDKVMKKALDFEVVGKRGRGQPNMTWQRQVEIFIHIDKIGLKKENGTDRTKWYNSIYEFS